MKIRILTLAAAGAVALAAPAAAQYGSQQSYGSQGYVDQSATDNIVRRIDQLEDRLWEGIDSGAIDRNERRTLRQDVRQLARLERQYSSDGLTQQERRDLQQRMRSVRQQLQVADGGNNARYADWDRDWDRDEGYGQDNRYREVGEVCTQQRTGLSVILRNLLGADNCLRVGERVGATASLGALPSQYRNEFRDRSGITYRYLEGNVVEIDTRTSVVNRIYDVG